MKTMFEYIAEQDKSFEEKPFTPADAVILSTLANINFSEIYKELGKEKVTLGELAEGFLKYCDQSNPSREAILLKLIKDSERYNKILVSDVVYEIKKNEEKQFGALTFYPTDDLAYVGYTGTGTSVVGYKEDLNMAYMDIIPAQRDSVIYLNSMIDKLPEEVFVGGFSKGGNLAIFASAFACPEIQRKITRVFNHDGPGFNDLIRNEEKYKSIIPLIDTYIPEASIVGLILNHDSDYKIVESTNAPFAQHEPYSWLFEGDDLKTKSKFSKTSRFAKKFQDQLLDRLDPDKRKDSIDAIFELIGYVEPDDFLNLNNSEKRIGKEITTGWIKADKTTKQSVKGLIKDIGKSVFRVIKPKKKM